MKTTTSSSTKATPEATAARTTAPAGLMRAVTQYEYGDVEVLKLEHIEQQTLAPDSVRIEVVAAGLDRGVWHLMAGLPYLVRLAGYGVFKPKNPVLGMDVSGRVVEIGDEVTTFAVGDEVFGIADGSYAEYTQAKEAKLAHKPANVPFDQAAVSAVSGITALQALTKVGRIEPGQNVLVLGAAGGVGSFVVQLAKAMGATVTGVGSARQLSQMRELGADEVLDYRAQGIGDLADTFDLIIDTAGRNPVSRLRRVLRERGTLVIVGGEGGNRLTGGIGRQFGAALRSLFSKQRLVFFLSQESGASMAELGRFMATGQVVPAIGQRFSLEQVPVAIARMQSGTLMAKTVIDVRS